MTLKYGGGHKCACCDNSTAFINTEYGVLCHTCYGDMYYEGLEQRKTPLSLDEVRKRAIENKTTYDLINGFMDRAIRL